MPAPHNRSGFDYYVYLLEAEGVPFYVGKGRAARAADRISFARKQRRSSSSLLALELHQQTLCLLQDRGVLISYRYVLEHIDEATAHAIEDDLRLSLERNGFALSNAASAGRAADATKIVNVVLALIEQRRRYRADPEA